jgi:hypothetical protein
MRRKQCMTTGGGVFTPLGHNDTHTTILMSCSHSVGCPTLSDTTEDSTFVGPEGL